MSDNEDDFDATNEGVAHIYDYIKFNRTSYTTEPVFEIPELHYTNLSYYDSHKYSASNIQRTYAELESMLWRMGYQANADRIVLNKRDANRIINYIYQEVKRYFLFYFLYETKEEYDNAVDEYMSENVLDILNAPHVNFLALYSRIPCQGLAHKFFRNSAPAVQGTATDIMANDNKDTCLPAGSNMAIPVVNRPDIAVGSQPKQEGNVIKSLFRTIGTLAKVGEDTVGEMMGGNYSAGAGVVNRAGGNGFSVGYKQKSNRG